jgi:excinuclease ABC subunit C
MVRRLEELLEGRGRAELEREIAARMAAASRELRYEEAARLRDELAAIESLALRGGLDSPQPPEMPRVDPAEALGELARALGLAAPPKRIEGLDLANLSGREAAGSIVTFLDGRPAKGFYRRYRIKRAPTDDDYAMMREVVGRRCRRLAVEATAATKPPSLLRRPSSARRSGLREGGSSRYGCEGRMHADARRWEQQQELSGPRIGVHRRASAVPKTSSPGLGGPDLLLLDGGAGHLAAGMEALKHAPKAGRPAAVCSLSKGDETIHLPDGRALHLPRTSPALKILQHVRDEAHRFAGQYHRKLRDKRTLPGR